MELACEGCGEGFAPRMSKQKFCSPDCRERTRWHRDPEYQRKHREAAVRLKRIKAGRDPDVRLRAYVPRNGGPLPGLCARCGTETTSRAVKYCSRECRFPGSEERARIRSLAKFFNPELHRMSGFGHYKIALGADPCAYCNRSGGERDHIVPRRVVGGKPGTSTVMTEWENLTGACKACNAAKSDKPLLAFLLECA